MINATSARTTKLELLVFALTRASAIVGSLLALAGIILAAAFFVSVDKKNTHVSHLEVMKSLAPTDAALDGSLQQTLPELRIPPILENYTDESNKQVFLRWLDGLDHAQKQDFVSNLSEVVSVAEKNSDDVVDVINAYAEMKLARLRSDGFDKYATSAKKVIAMAFGLAMVGLLILSSLVMVLLSIERNTRSRDRWAKGDIGTAA